ncbi:sodium:solute symporter family protein [Virgibacillus salidurans]|uniref:sodium:solute symporter family protein n=1 Tax=Virgibacillus salidurans TaxID=2831673 RepID=UPI001F3B8D77|nr:sodium:solute symporter family protein [Virgibacillus sp. NKC19-16]
MEQELAFGGWSGILILVIYGLLMLGIGFATYLKNRNIRDSNVEYYLGGKELSVFVLFFTFYASQYSGNTIVGYAPQGYRIGFEWIQSITFMILVIMVYLIFAPRLYALSKKFNFITPVDWLQKRFNYTPIAILGAFIMLFALGNFLLEQLVAIGQGVSGLTGGTVPYQFAVLFFVVIMLIYSWLGGMRAVAYTDTMQGIALLVGVFVLVIGSIIYFGGLPTSADYMEAYSPELLGVPEMTGINGWLSMLILASIGAAIYPHSIQRIFAAKSVNTLKKSFIGMAWMPFFTTGLVFLIGIIGINAVPGLGTMESENLVGIMANMLASQHLIFYWAMIILFGGIVAAIISTADSIVLSMSSIVSRDIYGRFINKKASEKKEIKVGKVVGIFFVVVLLILAWYPPATLFDIFVLKLEILIQLAPAIILGLYWKGLHSKPVFAGMLIGSVVASFMTFTGLTPLGIYSGVWGLLVNLIICVGGSLIVKASPEVQQETKKVIGF